MASLRSDSGGGTGGALGRSAAFGNDRFKEVMEGFHVTGASCSTRLRRARDALYTLASYLARRSRTGAEVVLQRVHAFSPRSARRAATTTGGLQGQGRAGEPAACRARSAYPESGGRAQWPSGAQARAALHRHHESHPVPAARGEFKMMKQLQAQMTRSCAAARPPSIAADRAGRLTESLCVRGASMLICVCVGPVGSRIIARP